MKKILNQINYIRILTGFRNIWHKKRKALSPPPNKKT